VAIIKIAKIASFWPATRGSSAAAAAVAPETDGLDAFGSEEPGQPPPASGNVIALAPPPATLASSRGRSLLGSLEWLVVAIVSAAVTAGLIWLYQGRVPAPPAAGRLVIQTTPSGLEVTIGDEAKGQTPLTLDLAPGTYTVAVGAGAQRRVVTASVAAGTTLVERLEMAPAGATGSLRVETDPAGLTVAVDGVQKGPSPLTISELTPGEHQVVVAGAPGPVRRSVSIRPNETTSLILSAARAAAPASSAGWVTVTSPVLLQLREDGKVIGSTEAERVMLPAGDHVLEFVNEPLGFRAQRRVSIPPGGTTRVALQVPEGRLSINAQPWAEVWLDGERLGVTPIGNFKVPIGSHELLFRHPEHGERRSTVLVGLQQAARVGIDMRKE
jgi:hypothetical protein